MKRHHGLFVVLTLALAAVLAGCWGSSKSTSLDLGVTPLADAPRVGTSVCLTCHSAGWFDVADGNLIVNNWQNGIHYAIGGVACEDCHGGGGYHNGVGPIPYKNPSWQTCGSATPCHGMGSFATTAHANPNADPAGDFSLGDIGDGTGPASALDVTDFQERAIFKADLSAVSKGEHVEECSRCHNVNQRFEYNGPTRVLVQPDPANLPTPSVTCGSCHYGHNPADNTGVAIITRAQVMTIPRFRPFFADNSSMSATFGAQVNAADPNGATVTGSIFQPNGSVLLNGTPNYARVFGTNNEIHPDRLCASCHTKGKYKYTDHNALRNVSDTHQTNVFSQYRNSGHGDREAPAFGEFSANPGAYNAAFDNGHRVSYPYDMSTDNVGTSSTGPPLVRNAEGSFACMHCHHGIGSTAFMDNVQKTADAPVLYGDVTVTCITCHDPHTDATGQTKNTRKPVVMTEYSVRGGYGASSVAKVTFSGNVFLDNTPVPSAAGNAAVCIFCHQGRESGFTLFKVKIEGTVDNNSNFFNPHYLGTGAMLWAHNGYEYAGKVYDANTAHQGANCTTCHMASPTADSLNGGHTWKPNVDACNTALCHGSASLGAIPASIGTKDPDLDGYRALSDTTNYSGSGTTVAICQQIKELQDNVIAALLANGIVYDDMNYPYFFKASVAGMVDNVAKRTSANGFKVWTAKTWKAAFNLSYVIKGLPSNAKTGVTTVNAAGITIDTGSATLVRNHSAAVHNHKYTTQLLYDALVDLGATVPAGATRVSTGRAATVYGTGQ
jgi:hypothetical protein